MYHEVPIGKREMIEVEANKTYGFEREEQQECKKRTTVYKRQNLENGENGREIIRFRNKETDWLEDLLIHSLWQSQE